MSCGWWNRWYHKRLREADRIFVLASLAGHAAALLGEGPEADRETLTAWLRFTSQRGQEHWLCQCGQPEQAELIAALEGE